MSRLGLQTKIIRETFPLRHKIQKGHLFFLTSFSERRGAWVWLDPILALDFVNGLCLEDYTGVIEHLYNLYTCPSGSRMSNQKNVYK